MFVPAGAPARPVNVVVAACRPGAPDDSVLSYAEQLLAGNDRGELHLVTVVDTSAFAEVGSGTWIEEEADELTADLERARADLPPRPPVSTHVLADFVVSGLASMAGQLAADMMVVGASSHGILGTALGRNIALELSGLVSCPVLVTGSPQNPGDHRD
jgi:nucleotide-binding universal stress UspA family protein